MSVFGLILTIAAFALLGLATGAHHRRWFGKAPGAALAGRMRLAAWLLIAASFPPAIAAQGWIFGPILWAGSIMFGAGTAFLALNCAPVRKSDR